MSRARSLVYIIYIPSQNQYKYHAHKIVATLRPILEFILKFFLQNNPIHIDTHRQKKEKRIPFHLTSKTRGRHQEKNKSQISATPSF